MWDYSDKVREHYLNPHNVGEVQDPDGVGEVGNIKCGDALKLTFKLDRDKRIANIKFKTFGCGSAIASSSVLTDLCKGKTLEEAEQITNKDIADALGGLPPAKMHCSVMGQEALEAAINYYRSGGTTTEPGAKMGHVVCTCFNVTDREIEKAVRDNNLKTIEQVTFYTKAGGGCGGCHEQIQAILDSINGPSEKPVPPPAPRMTNLQKIEKIREVIDNEVRPILNKDGGCAFSRLTQDAVVQDLLRKKVLPGLSVKQA
jgi:NifU-like protein